MRPRPSPWVWALPVLGLVAGGGAAWLFQEDGTAATTAGSPEIAEVAWDSTALEGLAPPVGLPARPDTATIDLASVVGYPTPPTAEVPPGAALSLTLGADGAVPVLDANTLEPVVAEAPTVLPPVAPELSPAPVAPSAPIPTVAPADASTTTFQTGVDFAQQFVDPCASDTGTADLASCSGAGAAVRDTPSPAPASPVAPAPLELTAPFAAAAGLADMCEEIERGAVSDPQLGSAVRPTVAVLANRPVSVALNGAWDDGTPIEKTTMLTLAAHETAWQDQWASTGVQGQVLACLTFPLDVVRSHAAAGRARLTVEVLGISSDGQDTAHGTLTLEVPLDGEDVPFIEAYSVRDLGEQRLADGRLAPALAVHYAIVDDDRVPAGSGLDAASLTVLDRHAAVENADCSGWAANAQGQDRTLTSTYRLRQEQRTINGRQRSVTVVDGVVLLDPNVRSGWEGFLCTQLIATDRTGARATLALRGAAVRAPRTAVYDVAVRLASPLAEGWRLDTAWADADGTVWCTPTALGRSSEPAATEAPAAAATTTAPAPPVLSASCTTLARLHPEGILITLAGVGPAGEPGSEWTVAVPVNASFCNPDDPATAEADGCDTGWQQTWRLDVSGTVTATVTVVVLRDAGPGQVATNPSHQWRIDPPQAFLF